MSTERFLLVAFAIAAAAAYALARPHDEVKTVVLADVVNKTTCPITVHIDEDPKRIPRRIKFLKCASRPNKLCTEQHISHGCCKQHHHTYVTECVEIHDWVQVTYKSGPQNIRVPVGCTCLIEETTEAAEAT